MRWISIDLIFREKQANLEKIRAKLASQMKMKFDDEDGRIKKAVEEAEERRAREDAEKEAKARKMIEEAEAHRLAMVPNAANHNTK